MALGDHDRALAWLDKLYTGRGAWVRGLKYSRNGIAARRPAIPGFAATGQYHAGARVAVLNRQGCPVTRRAAACRSPPSGGRPMMFWKRLEHLLPWRRAAEDARGEWGWTRLEQTGQDIRYAIRTLSKSPGFTLAAVLSLAIGIGANTALFTVINTVMWKRLPVSDPEHLLTIGQQSQAGTTSGFTYQQCELFRDHGQALDLAVCSLARLDASIDGQAEPTLDAQLVTGEQLSDAGPPACAGASLDEGDDRVPMGHQVAVLSHTYWQRRFAGEPTVIGPRSRSAASRSPSSASRRPSSSARRSARRQVSTCR